MAAFEVIALDTATPQLRAPGASDTYTFPRQALFLAGTTAAPGIAQTSDDNTGMWWPAADTLAWSLGGTEQMRLTSTGLGIGTSSPSRKLDVQGAPLGVGGNGTGVLANFVNNTTAFNASPTVAISLWNRYNSGGSTFPSAVVQGGKENVTDGNFAGYLSLQTTDAGGTSTERMRLDSSGNLGLGVTPSASSLPTIQSSFGILSGNNQTNIAANAYYSTQWNYTSTAVSTLYTQTAGQHRFFTAPSGIAGNAISFSQVMTLDASGNLALGQTSSALQSGGTGITLYGSSASELKFLNSTTGQSATDGTALVTSGSDFVINNREAGAITFGTNNQERARIPAAGGMVVGTAALATTATDGFLYVPTCAGTPTGTPTTQTGTAPIVVDTTNNKLYFYSGGAWRDAGP